MANTKFLKYFKKTLIKEDVANPLEPEMPPMNDDKAAFDASFDGESGAKQLEDEITNSTLDPQQTANILKKADKYAQNIDKIILPLLRNLHNDIIEGAFKTISPDIRDISGITVDLAGLAEQLRGKTRDAILKNEKEKEKTSKQ